MGGKHGAEQDFQGNLMNRPDRIYFQDLLYAVWGCPNILWSSGAEAIAMCALPGESALETCARMAGVDVSGVSPFDHMAIRARLFRATAGYRQWPPEENDR